jgi:hypothetical protein
MEVQLMPEQVVNGNANKIVETSPADIPIPADWAKLGLMTGYNPKTLEAARIYFTGLAGDGKSTFVASIPNSIHLDFEGGASGIPGRRSTYVDIPERARKLGIPAYDLYKKIFDKLIADAKAGKRTFTRVIIDTQDAWKEMLGRHLLAEKSSGAKTFEDIGELGMKGHGHSLLQGRCNNILGDLEDAGYTWAVVGHLTYVTATDPVTYKESTKIRPILSKGYVGPVVRKAELHITINSLTKTEGTDLVKGDRVFKDAGPEKEVTRYSIYTRPTEAKAMEGKRRGVPQLPARMEVPMIDGWKVLKTAYDTAVEQSRKDNGG